MPPPRNHPVQSQPYRHRLLGLFAGSANNQQSRAATTATFESDHPTHASNENDTRGDSTRTTVSFRECIQQQQQQLCYYKYYHDSIATATATEPTAPPSHSSNQQQQQLDATTTTTSQSCHNATTYAPFGGSSGSLVTATTGSAQLHGSDASIAGPYHGY